MADSSAPHSNGGAGAAAEAVPRSLAPPRRVALVTGITGQDGSYLTELLLSKGYEVHGDGGAGAGLGAVRGGEE